MPRILGVSTAVPSHTLIQRDAKSFVQGFFSDYPNVEHLLPVFDNARIDERHFVAPPEWYATSHSFTETNALYVEQALALSEEVACGVSQKCGIALEDVDLIIFVSTTGLSTPSIDARLFNRLKFNRHVKRLPIWGLGCAGGASSIARAFDYATAHPDSRILLIAVELCSLAFERVASKESIVACALFGDGAAACIIVGDAVATHPNGCVYPDIVDSLSTTYDDTLDVMGWRFTSDGFKVLLSKDIPNIVTNLVRANIGELLDRHQLQIEDIAMFVTHPGGTKVLDAYKEALGFGEEAIHDSREILRLHGNMSGVTIFFILDRFLSGERQFADTYGLISALGPGFSSELVLLHFA